MYGSCHKCGALFGTMNGTDYYEPCEHIIEEHKIIMENKKITPNNSQGNACDCGSTIIK